MKRILILLLLISVSCKDTKQESKAEANSVDKTLVSDLEVYNYDGLEPLINKSHDDKVHVVNFWATWCAPCIKELPYFEKINEIYKNQNLDVLLVSLDFPRQYESKLKPFIKEKNLKSKVVCLDDTNQNRWIPAIDNSWSGALPATIIYRGNKRKFYERSFTYEELENEVKQFLN